MAKKNGNGLPAELETAFADDSGIGFEEVTTSDLQIPFLRLVQTTSPQLKKSRAWLSLMMMQKHNGKSLPMFATTYRLKSVEESNDKGDWYNWIVAQEGRVPSIDAYNDAKEMHGSISRGELQIAPPVVQDLVEDQIDNTIPF